LCIITVTIARTDWTRLLKLVNLKENAFVFKGHIAYTDPPDACQKVERPSNKSDWIAVISMSDDCGFHDQVDDSAHCSVTF